MRDRVMAEFAALEEAADGFQQVLDALRRVLAGLDRELRASLARWEGDAESAYRTAHGEWQAAATDMAERLAWLHRVIVTAHGNYGASLTANLSMWDAG